MQVCDYSLCLLIVDKSRLVVLSCGSVYYNGQSRSNFCVCGGNSSV